jgi:hypothetical protein
MTLKKGRQGGKTRPGAGFPVCGLTCLLLVWLLLSNSNDVQCAQTPQEGTWVPEQLRLARLQGARCPFPVTSSQPNQIRPLSPTPYHCWTAGLREAPVRGRACTIPVSPGFQSLEKLTRSDVYPVLGAARTGLVYAVQPELNLTVDAFDNHAQEPALSCATRGPTA